MPPNAFRGPFGFSVFSAVCPVVLGGHTFFRTVTYCFVISNIKPRVPMATFFPRAPYKGRAHFRSFNLSPSTPLHALKGAFYCGMSSFEQSKHYHNGGCKKGARIFAIFCYIFSFSINIRVQIPKHFSSHTVFYSS